MVCEFIYCDMPKKRSYVEGVQILKEVVMNVANFCNIVHNAYTALYPRKWQHSW
jgi:hypothetical protein